MTLVRFAGPFALAAASLLVALPAIAELQVTATTPPRNVMVEAGSAVSVTFDRPLSTSTVTPASFRVFGRWSGAVAGSFSFTNGDRTVTFTRVRPFFAGEIVSVTLSHDLRGADLAPLRSAGFFWQFMAATATAERQFDELDVMPNRTEDSKTRIYGASAGDLNGDGFPDLTTVNEVSADVRVALNLADGSGRFGAFLAPQAIGPHASPNEPADFDNDGISDLCISATATSDVWVLMGQGDGTFDPITSIPVGSAPHGITPIDVDGDGDPDIVNANWQSGNLSLLINDGSGNFSAPVFFDGLVGGEWGLAAGDVNDDGIADLVVGGTSRHVGVLLGNGNASFSPAGPIQDSGGYTWVVALGDLDGDRILDAVTANNVSSNGAVLLGQGNGTFGPPTTLATGYQTTSADVGDLDGDGDLDIILSVYGGGFWRIYTNDGAGTFTFDQQIAAPSNPSCAVPLDIDNDRDLDLVLTDEIADVVVLMENRGSAVDVGPPVPARLALLPNAPDPVVSGGTLIRFGLAEAGDARIAIYDGSGRQVAAMERHGLPAGWHSLRFDGRDRFGRPLPAGVYFYAVAAGGLVRSDRMVVLR